MVGSGILLTDYGLIKIFASLNGVCRLELKQKVDDLKEAEDPQNADPIIQSFIARTKEWLDEYFNGSDLSFPGPLDLYGYTDFQKAVWNATRMIPYGQLRSYKWVAEQIMSPRSYRAVGQALSKNPLPIIIPCHRVVGSDGKLHGFTGGLHWKQKLIELEHKSITARLKRCIR